MNAFLISLLAAALCVTMVDSLLCYSCPGPTPSAECTAVQNCSAISPKLILCKTTVYSSDVGYPFQGTESVIRNCAETCIQTDPDVLVTDHPVFCCNSDLCNNRGVNGVIDTGGGDNTGTDNGSNSISAKYSNMLVTVFAGVIGALLTIRL